MSGDRTPCPVHSLIEDIESGDLGIRPLQVNLGTLAVDPASLSDPVVADAINAIRRDARAIADSHKFDFSGWPYAGSALSDVLLQTGKDMLVSRLAALPYPDVVFCRRYAGPYCPDGPMEEVFVLRQRDDHGTPVLSFRGYHRLLACPWNFDGFTATYHYGTSSTLWAAEWIGDPNAAFQAPDTGWPDDQRDNFPRRMVSIMSGTVASALAALSSKGPEVRIQPAPKDLNKRRAKKGKVPLFEYRIVEIPAWAKAKAEGLGGAHASPRLHWRRGHVRHLHAGSTTLVRPCLVGVAENGFIHKDYAVAPVPTD